MSTHTHTNKNAYEIRLEILKMAHDAALGRYHHKISTVRDDAQKFNKEFDENLIESLFPNTKDILAHAAELYTFVEGRV